MSVFSGPTVIQRLQTLENNLVNIQTLKKNVDKLFASNTALKNKVSELEKKVELLETRLTRRRTLRNGTHLYD